MRLTWLSSLRNYKRHFDKHIYPNDDSNLGWIQKIAETNSVECIQFIGCSVSPSL